jgi:energy-coupling factor transport system ATP-binding protein
MISIDSLTYSYPGSEAEPALRGLSLSLRRGEKCVLMGGNGSGKTTLLTCINGLLLPDSGDVTIDGLNTRNEEDIYEIRRRVGMVFQNPDNQMVAATVIREIAFGLENIGSENDRMKEQVEAALKRFHLEEYRESAPHLLSGGEKQRLALASVWVLEPDFLILDEPTSLLDPESRNEVLQLLSSLGDEIGVLLVTQYPDEALLMDRLIIMDRGNIIMDGTPAEVFSRVDLIKNVGLNIPVSIELDEYIRSIGAQLP